MGEGISDGAASLKWLYPPKKAREALKMDKTGHASIFDARVCISEGFLFYF